MKTVLLFAGVFIVGFIVLFAGTYMLYPTLQPEKASQVQQAMEDSLLPPIYDYTKFSPLKLDTLKTEVTELQNRVEQYRSAPQKNKLLVDSLLKVGKQQKRIITRLRDSLSIQRKMLATKKKQEKKARAGMQFSEVSKSLLSMDQNALAPILKKLNDNMLVGLYRDGSNMQREKLLQSLDPDRAAKLLKKVTQ